MRKSRSEASESLLWVGGVGGRYTDVVLFELRTDLRLPALVGSGPLEMRNGLLIVVTRMACLRRALSETSLGRKLMSPSKGR